MSRFVAFTLLSLAIATVDSGVASAQETRHSLEFAWRWAANPSAIDGVRVLDTIELGARIGVAPHWSIYPHVGYGVSYGRPWYMLGALGLEALWSPESERFVPRIGFGLAVLGEGISREGQRVFRDSFATDVALTLRGGGDWMFAHVLLGLDLRLAVAPLRRLDVAGPVDVGAALRFGVRLPRRRTP